MQTVLAIAGFDPSSGAGITADLMVFAAHGLFGASAITALTVQSTLGVRAVHPVAAGLLRETLDFLAADLPPAGIKIGMLGTAANVAAVCDFLEAVATAAPASHADRKPRIPIVLDPVLRSSSGRELLDPEGFVLLRDRLLPLVDWVTPNLDELALLTGIPVSRHADLPPAARRLQAQVQPVRQGTRLGIFAKGGHLQPPDDLLLPPEADELWLPGEPIATRATHGTGCALSSAFLSRLVLGDPPEAAAAAAKSYVAAALRHAVPRGAGTSGINHLWNILQPKREV
jgi:hydroxymethylpyrimidine/phosphomethylpyrimidine kinase